MTVAALNVVDGAVKKLGVMVRVRPPLVSAPVAFGVLIVPFVATAAKVVVVRKIGWLNVIVRTPVDVTVPGTEFDAEVA